MDPQQTQPSLLSRVRDPADHAAWHEFDARYRELIVRYCRRRGLQSADAEDVRQLVMMDLARGLRTFQYDPGKGRFRNYLCQIVRRAIFRHTRRPNADDAALDSGVLAAVPADAAAPDAEWEQEWLWHHYRLALETVRRTFDARSVELFDKLVEGDAVDGLAREYGMSEQAVHKVKQRIRNRMQELVEAQIQAEDSPDDAHEP